MTALFVTRRFWNVDAVYSAEMQKKLAEELDFLAPVKSMDELDARKEELQKLFPDDTFGNRINSGL